MVVVDNAPAGEVVERLVERLADGPARFRYHAEPRPGLSWARNAGIAAADGDIVAFLDDDDEPDRHWLAGIAPDSPGTAPSVRRRPDPAGPAGHRR